MDLKLRVARGVEAQIDPAELVMPESRFARAAVRVALRQIRALAGPSPSLNRWRLFYDRVADVAMEDDEQAQHG